MAESLQHPRRHVELLQFQQAGVLGQQAHHYRLAVLGGHGRDAHIHRLAAHLHVEAAVLGQAFFRDVQARHELQAQHQGRGDLAVGLRLDVEHAVDAEADEQGLFLGLDVDVRGPGLHGFLEHRLQQLDDRRVFRPRGDAQRGAELDGDVPHLLGEFLGQAGDFLGTPVDVVEERHQLALDDHRQVHFALDDPRNLVVAGQVGGIGKAHPQHPVMFVQHQGAEAARLGLGEQLDEIGLRLERAQVHELGAQLAGQRLGDALFRDVAAFDEDAAELAAAALLFIERQFQLLVGEQPLLDQQVPEADPLRRSGHEPP